MRILLAATLLLLGACNVERDPGNDTTTLSFNEAVAENAAEDAGNVAKGIGGAIANEAEETANKIGDVDVDVNVSREGNAEANHADGNHQ
jgi:hypothetical protein